jgi:hypothetical protein
VVSATIFGVKESWRVFRILASSERSCSC